MDKQNDTSARRVGMEGEVKCKPDPSDVRDTLIVGFC